MRKTRTRFAKDLGLRDSVLLGVGFIIGSGIFLFPIIMASMAGTYSLLSWVIGGVFTIVTGFCFAENASRIPKAGGLYSYAHQELGNTIGFLAGWSFWIGYWLTISTETKALSLYSAFFLPVNIFSDFSRLLIATAVVIALTAINYRGVKEGSGTQNIFTIGKIIPLVIFVAVGAFLIHPQNYYPLLPANTSLAPAVGSAIILALWAYLGVEIITVPEEEIKDAKRTVPRAILISVFIVMAVYLAVSATALGLAPWSNYVTSKTPLADTFQNATQGTVGNLGGILLAIGGLISIVGSINAVVLGTSRVAYAMARDNLFPSFLNHLHPKFRTPDRAMLLQFVLAMIVLYSIADLTELASLTVLFTIIPYLLSCWATFQLVRRSGWKTRILRTRYTPIIAAIFCVALFFFVQLSVLLLGLAFIIGGLALYYLRTRTSRLRTDMATPVQARPTSSEGSAQSSPFSGKENSLSRDSTAQKNQRVVTTLVTANGTKM